MQTKSRLFSILAAIPIIIAVLLNLTMGIINSIEYESSLLSYYSGISLFNLISEILLIVFLFMNNKKLAIIPLGLMFVCDLSNLIDYIDLYSVMSVVVDVMLIFILLASTVLSNKIDKKFLKYFWFVPALLFIIVALYTDIQLLDAFMGDIELFLLFIFLAIMDILSGISYFLFGYWASEMYAPKITDINDADSFVNNNTYMEKNQSVDGYHDLLVHIVLLLFTFGIWQFIWIYKTTSYLNNTPDEEYRNPTTKLLLCMFVPFYYIYWTYKSAQRIDKLAISKGQQSDISTLCLILSILVDIVPPIIMQDKINNITKKNKSIEFNEKITFCRSCGTQLFEESIFCNKCGAKVEETSKSYVVCIFDATTHTLRKEKKAVDIAKFPPSKFADNDTYYAVETFRDGKKVRIYYTKDNWNKQIEIDISEEEK